MKTKFEYPDIEIVRLGEEDIICASDDGCTSGNGCGEETGECNP